MKWREKAGKEEIQGFCGDQVNGEDFSLKNYSMKRSL